MEINRAYKFRIYPNKIQEQKLLQTIGACRYIYNYYLNIQLNSHAQAGRIVSYADLARDLTKFRNSGDLPWMREVQAAPMQKSLRLLDVAYSNYFKGVSKLPRFRSKKDSRQSFSKAKDWGLKGGRLRIQGDIVVRVRGSLPPEATEMKTLTVSVTPTGKWFASICVIESIEQPYVLEGKVGIDLGLTHTVITSEGEKFENLRPHKTQLKKLRALQQSLARKQGGSNRREKTRLRVARLHEKIANQRLHHLHQISSAITGKNHALIAVEDLAVANMLKNRRLSRSISDVSWGELLRQLEYKQAWKGGQFVKVGRFFPSSKTCSNCQLRADKMPLSIREWSCVGCGTTHDRDINAAKNILKQAEAQLVVESTDGSPLGRELLAL
jgi:putative transposase